ncbi:MAG: hypothetical protein USCAAHI_03110 [Beijerinckiaceae bacterium]|nr:MAG: hypothetical protein USCAAHI_03110 [Beijerinckiaceae bacterium]
MTIAGITGALVYGRGFHRRFARFDDIGFVLLAVILGGVQIILNQGNDFEWFQSSFLSGVLIIVIVDIPASYDQIFWPMLLLGFWMGCFFTPLTVISLHGLSGWQVMRAAEEATILRITAGAFGITLQGVILYRRTPFHQLDLADFFGGRRFASLDLFQQFSRKLENSGLSLSDARREVPFRSS